MAAGTGHRRRSEPSEAVRRRVRRAVASIAVATGLALLAAGSALGSWILSLAGTGVMAGLLAAPLVLRRLGWAPTRRYAGSGLPTRSPGAGTAAAARAAANDNRPRRGSSRRTRGE